MCWLPFWNLQKHRKKAPPIPNSVATSFLLYFLPFVIFPKDYQEHSPEAETAFHMRFFALTVAALRRRHALTQYFPSQQPPFFFEPGNSSDQDSCIWSIFSSFTLLIMILFDFFFHSPHLAGAKRQEDTEHTGEPTLEAPGEVKSLGHSVGSLNQRLIEWFGMEGPLKIILFQLPCCGQEHLPLDEVA